MIIPIGDVNRRRTFPAVNYLLIAANSIVFALTVTAPEPARVYEIHALVPARWDWQTILTSMFLHADLWHLAGNMLFLWIAGDNVEDKIGHLPYLFFYLAAGVAGSLGHIYTIGSASAEIPTVGASGAISGVLGAYLIFFPSSRIKFVFYFFILKFFTAPSWVAILGWVVMQVLMGLAQLKGEASSIAVFAHLAGFAFGLAFAVLARMLFFAQAVKESI